MVKTGGSIFIALSLVVTLLSLLPVCVIFVRKIAGSAILTALKILCSLVCLQYLAPLFIPSDLSALQTGFKLAAFTLVFYLFKLMMPSNQGKYMINMFLVSFLSAVITIYSLKGITAYSELITVVQAVILTVLALITLFHLISNRHIVLVNDPAFWIAGGLFCYYGMGVFMEAIPANRLIMSQHIQQEKDLIIIMVDILRMIFFIVAASIAGKRTS